MMPYCVSNMPAAVPHTSTFGLTNATVPYLLTLANKGLDQACQESVAPRNWPCGKNQFPEMFGRGSLALEDDRIAQFHQGDRQP